jgi:hypothetical protein
MDGRPFAFISTLVYFLWHLLPLLGGRQRN